MQLPLALKRYQLPWHIGFFFTVSLSLSSYSKRYPWVMAQYREYLRWCAEQGIESQSSTVLSLEDYSARIIQSWWRKLAGQVQVSSKQCSLHPNFLLQFIIMAGMEMV